MLDLTDHTFSATAVFLYRAHIPDDRIADEILHDLKSTTH